MTPLLIATTNPGKIREIVPILAGVPVRLLTLADLDRSISEPEETGTTFAANAQLKAHYYAAASGLLTVAEDSGLEIDALDGRPGIYSARYPGDTYPEKFHNLYAELAAAPLPWTARYVCALALATPTRLVFEAAGTVDGRIAPAPRGVNGFGYDPIFESVELGVTFGEADDARKRAVAHRARAFEQLRAFLVAGGLDEHQ